MVGIEKNEILYTVKTTVHFYSYYTVTLFATCAVTLLTGVVLVLLYIQPGERLKAASSTLHCTEKCSVSVQHQGGIDNTQ